MHVCSRECNMNFIVPTVEFYISLYSLCYMLSVANNMNNSYDISDLVLLNPLSRKSCDHFADPTTLQEQQHWAQISQLKHVQRAPPPLQCRASGFGQHRSKSALTVTHGACHVVCDVTRLSAGHTSSAVRPQAGRAASPQQDIYCSTTLHGIVIAACSRAKRYCIQG